MPVLNDSLVRSAEAGIIWDNNLKGFGLRVGKNTRTFIVLVASGRRKKLGRYPFMSLAQARANAKTILAEKTLGTIVPKHVPFDDAKKQFLEDCKTRVRASTYVQYSWCLGLLKFDRKGIGDFTGADILKQLSGLTASNKEHCFRVSRTFFTWCYNTHLIERNPFERLEPPPAGKARDRVLSEQELRKVYREAQTFKTPIHCLIWLLVRTGQRVGECRKLRVQNLTTSTITFPGEVTKNGRIHTIPISKATHKAMMKWPRTNDHIFQAARTHVRGKPVQHLTATWNATEDFKALCKVTEWTLHDLRRSAASCWQQLGVRVEVIEAMLNHVSGTRAGVAGIYQRYGFGPEMASAYKLWEAKLKRL